MNISTIIKELEKIKEEHGDIHVGCDFGFYENNGLCLVDDLDCIFARQDGEKGTLPE